MNLTGKIHHPEPVIWLDVAAVLVGAFLPFFLRGDFDISIISFSHLSERFELLTIITFGEGVVGMADKTYYHEYFVRTGRQIAFTVSGQILGTVIVLVSHSNVYGVITGLLVMSSSQLISLLKTYLTPGKDKR